MSEFDPIGDNERLSRFVIASCWIRSSNGTVKADAFMPPDDLNISVTRHANLAESEIWTHGRNVAMQRNKQLYGRADLTARSVRIRTPLDVVPAPLLENPQHAHVVGWPADKPSRKILAQMLAADATLARPPDVS